tara:strand:+ start:145 stop:687 length:543 start_codon:yes stop_codon:yes gene_type:complete
MISELVTVNTDRDEVILVNEFDLSVGFMDKMEAHEKGILHRAFSVFVVNPSGEIMLQRRALSKYHSPGLWTNTCCSHQRKDEETRHAAHRRMKEEMGFDCPMSAAFEFTYKAEFDNGLIEHEYDHVLIGKFNGVAAPNPEEVEEWKFLSILEIEGEIKENPEQYTEWFKIAFPRVKEYLS